MKIKMQRFEKPFEPGKEKGKKRNSLFGVIVFLLAAVVIVALVSIGIEAAIRDCVVLEQKETWVASVASYWGGIIGGVVSGILAFLGVFYTIRYYKESDAQKERTAVQPFLLVELGHEPKHEIHSGFGLGDPDDKEKQKTINVTIRATPHIA